MPPGGSPDGSRAGGRLAEEQAALRRVAVLVARGALPEEIFAAVTAEVRRLLDIDLTGMARYNPDGTLTTVARWNAAGAGQEEGPVPLGGLNVGTMVSETGRPARLDDYSQATGPLADAPRELGVRSCVGVPVNVEGRLWGVMIAASVSGERLPTDTEARLAGFTELAGTAIANAQARVELRGHAEEQAALRRVAVLVARAAPPQEVLAAVAEEIGRVLSADVAGIRRYDPDGKVTGMAAWSKRGTAPPAGIRLSLGGRNLATLVFQTGLPARIDDYDDSSGEFGDAGRKLGFRSAVGVPVKAAGRLWGVVSVGSYSTAALPSDTEARLAAFTELAGTAIGNAEAHAALAASRARIVASADEARRRIERDLHDGAQQSLVTAALQLRELQALVPPGSAGLVQQIDGVAAGLKAALEELRELARGIHPGVLADGGLPPALRALARRSPVPATLHVQIAGRLPASVEIAAYYVVCEALTNTAKHAHASAAEVDVAAGDGILSVCVRDDGRGGADLGHGSGLVGLKDRVEALGGRISLCSPPGEGTTLQVHIPQAVPPRHTT